MHLPMRDNSEFRVQNSEFKTPTQGTGKSGVLPHEEDEALRIIFEKTYGPAKTRQLLVPVPKEIPAETTPETKGDPMPGREILLVDGYNVLFAWEEWKPLLPDHFDAARVQLTDLMCDYAGMTGKDVILVFDAYKVKGNPGSAERHRNIYVVYTKEAQTADAYIEKTTLLARQKARVRVVTSDRPEQLIALGNEAMRTSAREFRREVEQVKGSIAEFIARNNRPGTERSIERLYKEAWKKRRQE
jgi:predicted RNA-binding protein with PIN domain